MFKILSWNVNGFRSILRKDSLNNIWKEDFDVICFQEVKLTDLELLRDVVPSQYYIYGNLSSSKGRNGVVILTKKEADSVDYVIGHERFDCQGRYISIAFPELTVINLYMPHGGRDKSQLTYKLEAAEVLKRKLEQMLDKNVIIATDFNIARNDIDVCRADQNRKNIMYTEEEKKIVADLCKMGYRDAYRELYPERSEYTWWSYAFGCRERNIGWRIDYFFISESLMDCVTGIDIMREQMGSDHCPITLKMEGK